MDRVGRHRLPAAQIPIQRHVQTQPPPVGVRDAQELGEPAVQSTEPGHVVGRIASLVEKAKAVGWRTDDQVDLSVRPWQGGRVGDLEAVAAVRLIGNGDGHRRPRGRSNTDGRAGWRRPRSARSCRRGDPVRARRRGDDRRRARAPRRSPASAMTGSSRCPGHATWQVVQPVAGCDRLTLPPRCLSMSRQQLAQLAFGAQSDLRGVVLRFQAQTSLPSVDSGSFGDVVDGFDLVHAADLGEQSPRGLQPSQWRR